MHLFNIVRMTVTNVGDIVNAIKDNLTIFLIKILSFSGVKFEGVWLIGDRHHRVEMLFSLFDDLFNVRVIGFLKLEENLH